MCCIFCCCLYIRKRAQFFLYKKNKKNFKDSDENIEYERGTQQNHPPPQPHPQPQPQPQPQPDSTTEGATANDLPHTTLPIENLSPTSSSSAPVVYMDMNSPDNIPLINTWSNQAILPDRNKCGQLIYRRLNHYHHFQDSQL